MDIPYYAEAVINRLLEKGYEAFAVGGCVRDTLLGRLPNDWDVTTDASPEKIIECFRGKGFSAIPTGISHGTITVVSDRKPVEVTTYRIDGRYTDRRRPDSVIFTRSLAEDLARRDFTINAMAYSPAGGFVDLFDGAGDLEKKVIRAVGEPSVRFDEDALRILRAIRFSSVLGFSVEERTAEAAVRQRGLLMDISRERISSELMKLLAGKDAGRVIREFAPIIESVIPELSGKTDNASRVVSRLLGREVPLVLAGLLAELDDNELSAAFARLRLPKKIEHRAKAAVSGSRGSLLFGNESESVRFGLKLLMSEVGAETAVDIIELRAALGKPCGSVGTVAEIISKDECFSLRQLRINGNRLKELGASPEDIGNVLRELLNRVISEKLENSAAALEPAAEELIHAKNCACDNKSAYGEAKAEK